ncbi:beta-N-acetylhexosaminidase [Dyella sp. A6]|uniref:beta-N-acetylhexosaminidase n=1 Tax=Dyella aluminiiresistens TaxID=3069105 RepID=UPI002E78F644|nr:family 20 glycosylhydrolase [Dyella sp. A6]
MNSSHAVESTARRVAGHWRRRLLARGIAALFLLAGPALAAAAPTPAVPALIPVPAEMQAQAGRFTVDAHTVIVVPPGDRQALFAANYLARSLKRVRGLSLPVRALAEAPIGAIVLRLNPHAPVDKRGGYVLQVDAQGATIEARDERGIFYGAITLWQLLTAHAGHGPVRIDGISIHDWPRFAWRGLMLDSARHFQSVDTIEQVLDAMARHKLDVFHWHLTDDQGWRIQIKRYPELTRIGAWRTPPGAGSHGEPLRYGGFYTQAQIRQVVAYAAARHIEVVPELDMPGHAQAAVASYPGQVGVTGRRPPVSVDWGVNPYLYNVDDRSLHFIENVLDEVMALFPSKYIHLGGDEAIKDEWKASSQVQAKMKALGISNENALQSWFTNRLGEYLQRHGRRLIGWDEILEGGLPRTASVMSWRGTAGAIAAAKQDHDVVLAPAGWLYFDNLQTRRADEPSGRLSVLPLSRVYRFEPIDPSLTAGQARHVLGVEAALWSEYMISPWQVQHALFPRVDALSEIAWSPRKQRDWRSFLQRLPAQMRRYRAFGIAAADTPFAPTFHLDETVSKALESGHAMVSLDNQLGFGTLRYTTDGSEPGRRSPVYARPFTVALPATVRAATFAPDGSELAAPRVRVFDRAALLTLRNGQLEACPGGNLGLRVPLLPDLGTRHTPVYDMDLFHACWVYPQAPLDTVTGIDVDMARLARNYGLAHDQSKVVAYPARTVHGELEVHEDRCDGPLLASLPLPAGRQLGERFALHGVLMQRQGVHDLCLRVTAPIDGPLYGLGMVRLLEGSTKVGSAGLRRGH